MVRKLSKIWTKYTVLAMALQMLLPALAYTADLKLAYSPRATELSAESKMQLADLLKKLEANPGLKLHLAAASPQRLGDHALGQERLTWVNAFFRERNLDLTPRIKSTTYLYTQTDNPSVIISW